MSTLTDILQQIWAAQIPVQERRRLLTRAVAYGMAVVDRLAENPMSEVELSADFQNLLVGVGELAGSALPSVTEAQEWLRDHGGAHLASRLARATEARDRRARREEAQQLLQAIRQHYQELSAADSGMPSHDAEKERSHSVSGSTVNTKN